MRRPLLVLAAATTAIVTVVLPASAATLTWLSPGAGAVVSDPVEIAVRVQREVGEEVAGVTVRLSRDGETTAPGTRTRDLRCAQSDGCNRLGEREDRWGLVQLGPDGGELATGPVCNGRYVLQAQPSGSPGWSGAPLVLTDPTVGAATGLIVDGEPRAAHLAWNPADSAGDVRQRVERRPEGASAWEPVAQLSATATSWSDQAVTAGTWEYRIVTTRGDGFVSGRPVVACADTEPDHTAASTGRSAVVAPGPTPTRSPAPDETAASGEPGGDADPSDPSGSEGTPADGTGAATATDGGAGGEDGASPRTSGPRTRVAAPPPARRGSTEVQAPAIARSDGGGDRYFGEGEAFTDELDYGDAPGVAASPTETSAMGRWIPGGSETITRLRLDERHVVLPIATGLLLLALGLHMRRWMRSA